MSTYTDASLIVTPNAKKAGKLYALKGADLDVVRATTATRVDANGLIEIPRTNLLLRSEEFDNAVWTKTAGVVVTSNSEISPNGTLTADTINFGASNRIVAQPTTLATGVVATGSIYVKGISGQTIQLAVGGVDVLFTLNGNWQRLEATRTSISSNINLNTFGGATARNIMVWGAQLEVGNSATEYIPTTSSIRTRFAGITQDGGSASNIPRIDYTNGSCPSILVEPQRTNLLLRSEEFDNASWSKIGSTITANTTTSPNGNINADTIFETATTDNHGFFQTASLTNATSYTVSFFIKPNGRNWVSVRFLAINGVFVASNVWFDISNGTIGTTNSGITATIQASANGFYRITATRTTSATGNGFIGLYLAQSNNSQSYTGSTSSGIFIYGAQLEAGANATSYIPTTSATVTRNADVISKTGLSGITSITETFENGSTNVISGSPTSYTMSQGRIKHVIGL